MAPAQVTATARSLSSPRWVATMQDADVTLWNGECGLGDIERDRGEEYRYQSTLALLLLPLGTNNCVPPVIPQSVTF